HGTPPTEIYTLSLHDALPILAHGIDHIVRRFPFRLIDDECAVVRRRLWLSCHSRSEIILLATRHQRRNTHGAGGLSFFISFNSRDRKSTRLNSSHLVISYAVF